MANICANVMCVYTYDKNEANLKKVYNILKENFTNCLSISEAVFHLRPDLSEKEIDKKLAQYETRGWIDCDSDITYHDAAEGKPAYIQIYYQSKWSPTIEAWDLAIEPYGLEEVTIAEEPGCEVYINTDTDHVFFTDKYLIDIYYNGNEEYPDAAEIREYYSDLQDALADVNKYFNTDIQTKRQLETYIETLAEQHEEGWANFAEFVAY